MLFLILETFALLSGIQCFEIPRTGEAMIYHDNITDYGFPSRPPVWNEAEYEFDWSIPTPVSIEYLPVKLLDLRQTQQELHMGVVLLIEWSDYTRLHWDGDEIGIHSINIPMNQIWYPKIGHLRSGDANYHLGGNSNQEVMVFESSDIVWVLGGTFVSSCLLDVTLFPFDVQTCHQRFAPWPVGSKLNLTNDGGYNNNFKERMMYYEHNSEWDITNVTTVVEYGGLNDPDPGKNEFLVTIELTRKPAYYTYTVMVPCMLLAFLVIMVFLIPVDAGEKISFGVTVLLTFSVFQLQVSNSLPHSSDSFPILGAIIIFLECMASISIVVSVIVLNIHHFGNLLGHKMGRCTRFLIFVVLAHITCSRKTVKRHTLNNISPFWGEKQELLMKHLESELNDKTNKNENLMRSILQKLERVEAKINEDHEDENITREWKLAAIIVDRFLMIVCIIVLVGGLLGLFWPIMTRER